MIIGDQSVGTNGDTVVVVHVQGCALNTPTTFECGCTMDIFGDQVHYIPCTSKPVI